MNKPTVSFFCPAYHDEENLPLLIPNVVDVLRKHTRAFEIVIVVDGDNKTKRAAKKLEKQYSPYVKLIIHPYNKGYGAALRSGFSAATTYEFVFYTDGDCQYDAFEIPLLLEQRASVDAVVGYRVNRALSPLRLVQTIFYNALIQRLFGLSIRDINCSMKLIRRDVLNTITLESESAFIDAELLIKLMKQNARIREVGVSHYPRHAGRAGGGKMSLILSTVKEIFNMKFAGHY